MSPGRQSAVAGAWLAAPAEDVPTLFPAGLAAEEPNWPAGALR